VSIDGEETFAPNKRRGLRSGFTTGACATAAALAAARWLFRGETPPRVTVHLPAGRDAEFEIANRAREGARVLCSVIKDGGDDPDVTHGAEIRARLWRPREPGLHLTASGSTSAGRRSIRCPEG
jgi:cobalt-precorrin-5B (C1)-methyltransferase